MNSAYLKKILAGLSIAGLLAASTVTMTGCASFGKSS